MQPGAFELPIRIRIYPSRWLTFGLLISHCGAVLILVTVSLNIWIKLLLFTAVVSSLFRCFYIYIWQLPLHGIIELILNDHDEWQLIRNDGQVIEARLRPGAFVHPLLVVLPFQYGLNFPTVILTPETVSTDTLRRLRVRLRYQRKF